MDVRQRADDALEALEGFRAPLADVRHELARAGHDALAHFEAFEKGPLAGLEDSLRRLAAGEDVASPEKVPAEEKPKAPEVPPAPPAAAPAASVAHPVPVPAPRPPVPGGE